MNTTSAPVATTATVVVLPGEVVVIPDAEYWTETGIPSVTLPVADHGRMTLGLAHDVVVHVAGVLCHGVECDGDELWAVAAALVEQGCAGLAVVRDADESRTYMRALSYSTAARSTTGTPMTWNEVVAMERATYAAGI